MGFGLVRLTLTTLNEKWPVYNDGTVRTELSKLTGMVNAFFKCKTKDGQFFGTVRFALKV